MSSALARQLCQTFHGSDTLEHRLQGVPKKPGHIVEPNLTTFGAKHLRITEISRLDVARF